MLFSLLMKICVITTSFPRFEEDDSGIFVKRLVEAMSEAGVSGYVLIPYGSDEPETENLGNFKIERIKYGLFTKGRLAFGAGIIPNLRKNPLLIFQAPLMFLTLAWRAFQLRKNYNVIHANWSTCAISAWVASLFSSKKYVITLRGEDLRLLSISFFRIILAIPIKAASSITSVNSDFLDKIETWYKFPRHRLHIIPNGVELILDKELDKNKARNLLGISPEQPVLLYVGTVIPRKRVKQLVQLVSNIDCILLICGRLLNEDYVNEVKQEIEKLNCTEKVKLEGQIAPNKIAAYYIAADVYVTASEFEGRSNSVLEAMSVGLPVFASNIPAHREIIEDNHNGILWDVDSIESGATSLEKLLADTELQSKLGSVAIKSVSGQNWLICAQNYLKLFKS